MSKEPAPSVREHFPHRSRVIEHAWIPMSDGVRLAARIWLPQDAEQHPVPAILEYIPYRLTDGTAQRDALTHPYLAGHGYAAVRVDLRGSGNSEGVLTDEYLQLELDDAVAVIAWLAEQPWCDGNVGMMGISWGGFNALQVAALQPPALKAIVTVCSTDDRYADDVHYMGGCLLGDNLSWASTMFAYNACPPDPEVVGERWRELWHQRLDGSGLWLETWLRHQHRDAYWRHGSICEDFSQVRIPVLAASGWADGYTNAVFRLLKHLDVPRLGLVGPWSHKYPHIGVPGPAIGFLQEMVRWWDRWLKGVENGIMDEPMLRAWLQDSVEPSTGYHRRPGRWVGEPSWPTPGVEPRELTLAPHRLLEGDAPEEVLVVQSPLSLGQFGGKWCSYSAPPDLPDDQREEDGGALVFETPALAEPLDLLGAPVLELELMASRPVAQVAARLSDVHPDGKATRITYGLLNLTHRDGHEQPEPLEPGRRYRIRMQLNDLGQRFLPGHRIRLALSSSYWPVAWPPPEPTALQVVTGASRLLLPVRQPRDLDEAIGFEPVETAPPLPASVCRAPEASWEVIRDLVRDVSTLRVVIGSGEIHLPDNDMTYLRRVVEEYRVQHDDLESIAGRTHWERTFDRDGWHIRIVAHTVLTSSRTHFHLQADLDAFENGRRVFCRTWQRAIPRLLV